ncbi:MAG TPA: hypothetical protein VFM66_08690 [Agromyces sp.]|nr:hypothetical protein [Agromyces sp.]
MKEGLLAAGLLILLAGCTGAEPSGAAAQPSDAAASSTPAAGPHGHTTVGCAESRPLENGDSPASDDLVFGPLRYPGLAHGYPGPTIPPQEDGVLFAKIGTELMPDATVTVSVASVARSWAGIRTEGEPSAGYSSVTYVSCATSQSPDGVWWVGGFTLSDRTSGCVPVEIRIGAEESIQRAVIAFWVESCV